MVWSHDSQNKKWPGLECLALARALCEVSQLWSDLHSTIFEKVYWGLAAAVMASFVSPK